MELLRCGVDRRRDLAQESVSGDVAISGRMRVDGFGSVLLFDGRARVVPPTGLAIAGHSDLFVGSPGGLRAGGGFPWIG